MPHALGHVGAVQVPVGHAAVAAHVLVAAEPAQLPLPPVQVWVCRDCAVPQALGHAAEYDHEPVGFGTQTLPFQVLVVSMLRVSLALAGPPGPVAERLAEQLHVAAPPQELEVMVIGCAPELGPVRDGLKRHCCPEFGSVLVILPVADQFNVAG